MMGVQLRINSGRPVVRDRSIVIELRRARIRACAGAPCLDEQRQVRHTDDTVAIEGAEDLRGERNHAEAVQAGHARARTVSADHAVVVMPSKMPRSMIACVNGCHNTARQRTSLRSADDGSALRDRRGRCVVHVDLLEQFDALLGPGESTRIVPEHDCPASVDGNRSAAEVGTFSRASGDPHGRTREAACRRELEPLLECRQLVNLV